MSVPYMPLTKVYADGGEPDSYLGTTYVDPDNGKTYRIVKASANIAAAAGKTVVFTDTLCNEVATTTTADNDKVAGVIPTGVATISSTSGQLDDNDVFWIQVPAKGTLIEVISAGAIADGVAVGTSTTAGKCDDATITFGGALGIALESAAGADETVSLKCI